MKCKKCGKVIKTGLVKNKEYGWVCVPCSHRLMFSKPRGVDN